MRFSLLSHRTVVVKSCVAVAQSWADLAQEKMLASGLIRGHELLLSCVSLCSEEVFHLYEMHEWQKGVDGIANGLKIH